MSEWASEHPWMVFWLTLATLATIESTIRALARRSKE
jgi:hypothetical protein